MLSTVHMALWSPPQVRYSRTNCLYKLAPSALFSNMLGDANLKSIGMGLTRSQVCIPVPGNGIRFRIFLENGLNFTREKQVDQH